MEGVPATASKDSNFIRDTLPVIGYAAASLGHLIAGTGGMSEIIPKPLTEFLDKYI
jgi:hypothetical protein